MTAKLELTTAVYSRAGRKEENQDAWTVEIPGSRATLAGKGAVLGVADGVSACSHAAQASQTAMVSFISDYFSTPESWTVRHSAARVISALNRWLYQQGHQNRQEKGSWCTTFTAGVLKSASLHILHVGDSRLWRYRNQTLECLTRDHTSSLGGRDFLARALGMEPRVEVDYQVEQVQPGDILLLTTDGIHGVLLQQKVQCLLEQYRDNLKEFCRLLVEQAESRGSQDNMTCVVGKVLGLPDGLVEENLARIEQFSIPPDLYPGQYFEGYRILELMHSSNRSQLYLCEDAANKRKVVLKAPSVAIEDDPVHLSRFAREGWIGRRVSHPALMQVYSTRVGTRYLYHVCEFIQGQTLRAWILDNPEPDLACVRGLVRQIVSAVRALHRLQILHQDLKPENILLDAGKRIRLIDYGASHIAGEQDIFDPGDTPPGTRNYIAPEYILDNAVDERADQFSIAVVVYELLSGKLPYPEQSGMWARAGHYRKLKYQPLKGVRSDIPEWFDCALKKALSPNPNRRYSSLSEFVQDMTYPNQAFAKSQYQPVMDRNPLLAWRLIALGLLLSNLWLLLCLFNPSV